MNEIEIIPIPYDKEAELNLKNVNPQDIMNLSVIVEDYTHLRNVVLENVSKLRTMINNISSDMELEGYDHKMVDSISKIISESNKSLKILTESYKSISDVLINIAKINSLNATKEENFEKDEEIISTAEVLKRLKENNT